MLPYLVLDYLFMHVVKFDGPAATGGVLVHSIAKYVSFVNSVVSAQLARFGLHGGMASAISLCFLTPWLQIIKRQAELSNPHKCEVGIIGTRTCEWPRIP